MSMPKFPDIDPNMTSESALNMILASIAMEELALSHILNAEGEKLQYVLKTANVKCCANIDDVLKVNHSITELIDSASQYQMLLKNKMDKALHALTENISPKPLCPPISICKNECKNKKDKYCCKCSGVFKNIENCGMSDSFLNWQPIRFCDCCISCDYNEKSKILIIKKGCYSIHFTIDLKISNCNCLPFVSVYMIKNHQRTEVYKTHEAYVNGENFLTIKGIITENIDNSSSLLFKVNSVDPVTIKNAVVSIVEI